MKKTIITVLMVLLVATFCYAQTRPAPYTSGEYSSQSNFTYLGALGTNVTGNPGYLMMRGVGQTTWGGAQTGSAYDTYYLWIDEAGDLCLASHTTISPYASFPTGNWDDDGLPASIVCSKVGSQS